MLYPKLIIIVVCLVILGGGVALYFLTFTGTPLASALDYPRLENFSSKLEYYKASLAWWEARHKASDPEDREICEEMVASQKRNIASQIKRMA